MGVTSTTATYSAVQLAGLFNYRVRFLNTSPAPYSIYAILFGQHYLVPTVAFPLNDVAPISAPMGWTVNLGSRSVSWHASWRGSALASGYILPGQTETFRFQSSTAPPPELRFGCNYHNPEEPGRFPGGWGYPFNGIARLVTRDVSAVVEPEQHQHHFVQLPIHDPSWWIETHGGLVPPGPPPPWMLELVGALSLGATANRISPRLRARVLQLALEQISIAAAEVGKDIEALQERRADSSS